MSIYLILFFKIILKIIPIKCQSNLKSHKILDQNSYYKEDSLFNNSFIDFINYKIYHINRDNIIHKNQNDKNFPLEFQLEEQNNISLKCINETCLDIELSEHKYISFDFDRVLSTNGGIYANILILYGLFSLKRGYIYINLSFIFYGSFGCFLFIREICQYMELFGYLTTLNEKSETIVYLVFYMSIIISFLYGLVCNFTTYLKYITLGFVEGIIISKIIFYLFLFIDIFNKNLLLYYFITETIICLIIISLITFYKNKNSRFTIVNLAIIGAFGIMFAINIICGGLPFIPFLILASTYDEKNLYEKILNNNIFGNYTFVFLIFLICGIYWNTKSYKKLKTKVIGLK